MANEFVEITEEEKALIEEHRTKKEAQKRQKDMQYEILQTAYEYEKWLRQNGAGSSFSTFCDDFQYDGGVNRQLLYQAVEEIRRQAWVKAA